MLWDIPGGYAGDEEVLMWKNTSLENKEMAERGTCENLLATAVCAKRCGTKAKYDVS